MENTDRPVAQNNLDQARDAYRAFTDRIPYYYLVGVFGGPLGAAATTIMMGLEANQLLGNYIEAKNELKEINDQIDVLIEKIEKFYQTHSFDDIFFNDSFFNDGGCNDGGCNA